MATTERLVIERPNGERHFATEADVRRTDCGLWIGEETWHAVDQPVTCATCDPSLADGSPTKHPVTDALNALADEATTKAVDAYLRQHPRIVVRHLAKTCLVTGLDMGIAFAVAFPDEARRASEAIRVVVGLTETDEAQRLLMFAELVEAARQEPT